MAWMIPAAVIGGSVVSGLLGQDAAKTQANAANNASNTQLSMFNSTQQNLAPYRQVGQLTLADLANRMGVPGYSSDPSANKIDFKGQTFDSMDALHKALYDDWLRQVGDPAKINESQISGAMSAAKPMAPTGPVNDPNFGSLTKPFTLNDFQASPAYQFNLEQGQEAIDKASAARSNFYAPATLRDIAKFSQGLASNEFQNAFNNYNTNLGNIWNRLYSLTGTGQNAATNMGGFGANVASNVGNNMIGAGNALAAGQVGFGNAISSGIGGAYNAYLMNQILQQGQSPMIPLQQIPGMAGANDINYSNVA